MIADPNTLLFDRLPIGAYRSTPAGRQLRANAALVRLNGYASEEEMLAATNDLKRGWYIHPGRRQLFKALIDRDGQVTDFVSEVYRHKTRERIWVRETAYAVRDAQGQMVYYEGTVEDITERHLAANALADSETRWRLALDAAGDGVWDWRVQTGEEFYSDRLLHMFGFKRGELAHSVAALDERTHPDDLAQMAVDREAHFSGRTPTYVNEHRVRCKDGSWKWVLSRGMVVSRDAQGQPLRMIGTHTDITQRKQAEELIWHQAHIDALTGLPNPCPANRIGAGGGVHGSGQLQASQRHPGPPRRRCPAGGGRPPHPAAHGPHRHTGPHGRRRVHAGAGRSARRC
jgi:PAS domain S-box-containing protein